MGETRAVSGGYQAAGIPPAVEPDDAHGVADLHLVNLLLAALAAACVIAALAGSIVH